MAKLEPNLRVKILLLFFLSNVSIYLLASGEETIVVAEREELIARDGYVTFSISAKNMTQEIVNAPIMIANRKIGLIAPHAFLIGKDQNAQSEPEINLINQEIKQVETYQIYVHKKYISKLLNTKNLIILPLIENFNFEKGAKSKRKNSYEITM